jgi:hypothetical protein
MRAKIALNNVATQLLMVFLKLLIVCTGQAWEFADFEEYLVTRGLWPSGFGLRSARNRPFATDPW